MSDPIQQSLFPEAALAYAAQGEAEKIQGARNLEEAAQKFEAVLLHFLVKQMWESVERSELLPEAPGRQIQEGMLTTMLADHLAEHGGIGIAKALTEQLERKH